MTSEVSVTSVHAMSTGRKVAIVVGVVIAAAILWFLFQSSITGSTGY